MNEEGKINSIRIIRVYVLENRRRIITNGELEKVDNLALNFFKDGYSDIIVNRRRYQYIGESKDTPIPRTSQRGDCLFYGVEELN